jgi:hypothetical protein
MRRKVLRPVIGADIDSVIEEIATELGYPNPGVYINVILRSHIYKEFPEKMNPAKKKSEQPTTGAATTETPELNEGFLSF